MNKDIAVSFHILSNDVASGSEITPCIHRGSYMSAHVLMIYVYENGGSGI